MLILPSTLLLSRGVESSLIQAALGMPIILLVSASGREARLSDTISPGTSNPATPEGKAGRTMKLYIGTYTRPAPYLAGTSGKGLYVLDFDEAAGALSIISETTGLENPTYLCISPDGRNLHAVSAVLDWHEGVVSSYAIDPGTGMLRFQGIQGARGTVSCYATMDSRSRLALVANYWSGTVAAFPARPDGSLAEASSVDQHEGTGPDAARQDGPHAHCIVISPDDRFAFSADLGADLIYGYRVDHTSATIVRHRHLRMPAGSGPRHFVFSPDARHAYVICELDSTVATLDYDAATGELSYLESYPMLPAGWNGKSHGADLHIHPSGRFVYGSNRGHDSITMFRVDPASGRLTLIGHRSTEGRTPRNFALSPDGRHLLAANQDSDSVVIMPIDPGTGELGAVVSVAQVPTPVCLKFAP